ncbi:hypothetical protein E3P89_02290 [Wallemia ichthyophaga]|uniref:SGTA homodimerisation domain-containing protein n=1 Tax=Wallemia ichthyophaga TaxID=245174 RepID=A0A4T0I1V4_WALIC|nr:hypothetical protein E3P90_02425 [Wallemia ichthyophaga]TIB12397.1 hypothetical protein E3P93_02260 [Wallemia ichthyophaga]TIB22043.1 hypothetical protein E3P89_02290 [Wallemia ichthyophaga]TIB23779.1 hypothetical protein E3P88_02381 [Wallemia ichthyophaga]
MENKKLNFAIAKYLKSAQAGLSGEKQESLSVAIESLEDVFEVDDTQAGALDSPVDLAALFKSAQVAEKPQAAAGPANQSEPSAQDIAKADTLKAEGNALMSAQKYQEAVDAYTQAIALHSTNKILYSNRAAAYSQAGDQDASIADAKKALEIDPAFARAYSRLGHAYFNAKQYDNAVSAYEDGLKYDTDNQTMKSSLITARSKVGGSVQQRESQDAGAGAGAGAGGGGMPDLSALAGMFGGAGGGAGGGGGGGMPDIGALLNNPMMRQMAQSMMSNGGMERLMSNPGLRNMAENMRSGGQMPSIEELAGNPELRGLAESFGAGGAGGAGQGNPPPGNA